MAGKILLDALAGRWEVYRAQLKLCQKEFSVEAIHDFRVATRRLLAVLDIVRTIAPHSRIKKVRHSLKRQIDDLDKLRDVQVILARVMGSLPDLPELQPFELYLQEREKHLLRTARKRTRSAKSSKLAKRMDKIGRTLKKQARQEDFDLLLLHTVDNAFSKVKHAFGQVDATRPSTIHRLRLAFKRFRYMVEIVHSLLPNYPDLLLKQMHDYQSAAGNVQDMETFLSMMTSFFENTPSIEPGPARRFFEKCHADTIAAFLEVKEAVATFWRPAPDQPFPWEIKHDPIYHSSRHRSGSGKIHGRRQPAPLNQKRQPEDEDHRTGTEGAGHPARPGPDQSLPAGQSNGTNSGEEV